MNSTQNSNLIAAAVGATIGVVSVAAVMIYNKIMERQQQAAVSHNLERVNRKVSELQAELAELKNHQLNLQKSRRKKLVNRKTVCSNNDTLSINDDIDTFSIADTDVADDEFFDCSDSDNGVEDLENKVIVLDDDSILTVIDKDIDDKSLQTTLYSKIKQLLEADPENIELIWRLAKVCYQCSEPLKDVELKKSYIYDGIETCEKVLHVRHGNLYKWYAILVGIKSGFMSTKDKIENGYRFKEYIEKALEITPNDSYLYHLLGRFKFEVSQLSWIERKVAATLFAEVPKATIKDAIEDFQHSEELAIKPDYENKLFLGKCHIALGQYQQGVKYLTEIKESHGNEEEEESKTKREANKLLKKYSQYCT